MRMSTDNRLTETAETLWCVHIPGPDDLYAAASREAADEHAAALNKAIQRFWERNPRTENDSSVESMTAVVIPWPGDAASHAKDVIRGAREGCVGNG